VSLEEPDYRDLYENAPCGYLTLAPDSRILTANVTFIRWIGRSADELAGKRLHDMLGIGARIFFDTHIGPLLRMQGFANEIALDLLTASSDKLPVLANAVEQRNSAGAVQSIRVTVLKAIDRRRFETSLVDAREQAEAAARQSLELEAAIEAQLAAEKATAELREQFIAVLGHDLRNPIASILSGVRLLGREGLTERGKSVLALMAGSAERASDMVDNIMDFARGRLGGGIGLLADEVPDLGSTVQQVVDEIRLIVPERAIEAKIVIDRAVRCDRTRIGQLASNLLGNAVTHGATTVPIAVKALTTDARFTLSVTNGGSPISPQTMEHLFQPFFRGQVRPSQQGLGLGLHIASEIARAHGGTIIVTSNEMGTCFTFQMPLSGPPGV
jgi:sigma-B regulation protein RsbU (phosphoserine phosphatase)